MVGVFQALVLGVLQGITEWLPVSSSGHLVLLQKLMRVEVPVFFDIVLHLGTLIAVLAFYSQNILKLISAVLRLDFGGEHGRARVRHVLPPPAYRESYELAYERRKKGKDEADYQEHGV